jgi:hypothetical protein
VNDGDRHPSDEPRRDRDVPTGPWYDGRLAAPTAPRRTVTGLRRDVLVVIAVMAVVAAAALAAHLFDQGRGRAGAVSLPSGAVAGPADAQQAPRRAVHALQTVPALPGITVTIADRWYTSGADGRIDLTGADQLGELHVLGRVETSPLARVNFTGWADGTAAPTRRMSELTGPVVQIGFTVAYRVQIAGTIGAVAFDSPVGSIELTAGQPVTLLAARARLDGATLVAEVVVYTLRQTADTGSAPRRFTPTPGAVWTVTG